MSENPGAAIPTSDVAGSESAESVTFKLVSKPANPDVPYQAPDLPPYFVPRAELLAIKKLLLGRPTTSLAPLTLHGPPGSGKTALAAAVAHDAEVLEAFPDGVLWYSLGEGDDPQHAQSIWGQALGNDLSSLPDTASRAAALRTMLRESRMLLVIDDVTNVEQVKALNVGGPNCVRLITTDKVDEISYAFKTRRYAVTRMREDEALKLLVEWAGILPDIYLPTVKEIIKRLGYSPLALALVGAQARQGITWLRLLEVLRDDQGPISTLDADDPKVREHALGLVINVVLSRFGGAQLQRSALLGAFSAGSGSPFSYQAAAACWQMSPEEARSTLDMLVEASLVQRMPGGYYALHSALRSHLCKTSRPDALREAAKRIREYYIALVEQPDNDEQIDRQLGQILAAYGDAIVNDQPAANLFTDTLMSYFERRGLWANLAVLATRAVDLANKDGDVMREHMYLADLGYAHTMLGDLPGARLCFERSLSISQKLGDPAGEAAALNNIGATHEREGHYAEAHSFYQRSLKIREMLGVREDIADALNNVAGVLYWQEQWDEALNTFQRALDMYGMLNDRQGQAQVWLNIGAVYERMGRDDDAEQAYQRSLAIYANMNNQSGEAQALNNLGIIYFNRGDTDRALGHFKRSLALKERLGDRLGEASTLNNIALLYEKTGALSLALEHYERAFQILDAMEDPRTEVVQENIDTLREQIQKG